MDYLIVVEEKRGFLEGEIKSALSGDDSLKSIKIFGKDFNKSGDGFPSHGGLNPEVIQNKIHELSKSGKWGLDVPSFDSPTVQNVTNLPGRLPTFCPGCPHRETLSLLKELRVELKRKISI